MKMKWKMMEELKLSFQWKAHIRTCNILMLIYSTISYHFSTLGNSKYDSTLETTIKILKIIKQNLTLCLWTIKSILKVIIHSYRDRSDPSRIFTGTNLSVMYAKTFSCCVLDVRQFVNLASIFCFRIWVQFVYASNRKGITSICAS